MHFDSSFRRPSWSAPVLVAALTGLLLVARVTQGLLVPPPAAQQDIETLQQYSELVEALHEQSGGYHQRFKALMFQGSTEDLQRDDDDDNVQADKKKGGKKEPKDGDGGDNDKARLVPVVLGVMSKSVSVPCIVIRHC